MVLNFIQETWGLLIADYTSFQLMVVGLSGMVITTYYLFGLLHLFTLDLFHIPSFLYRTKIQPQRPFDSSLLGKLLTNLLFNQLFILVPFSVISWYFRCGYPASKEEELICLGGANLPSISEIIVDIAVFIVIEEILFFYSHLLLHRGLLYDKIHRKHHEFRSPIALAAAYCHPIEMLLANVIPINVGPFIMKSHFLTTALWYFAAILGTQMHHCGFKLPWLPGIQPQFHDLHHETFSNNYGLLGILDWLHGTYITKSPNESFSKNK